MSTKSRAETIIQRWKNHRDVTFKLVNLFPETEKDYRPTPEVMNLIEMIHHIAWTPDFFFATIEGRKMDIPPLPETLAEANDLLEQLTEKHWSIIRNFSEEDFDRVVTLKLKSFVSEESIEDLMYRIITHEAHHKGQLMTYARMLNIKPPMYTVY